MSHRRKQKDQKKRDDPNRCYFCLKPMPIKNRVWQNNHLVPIRRCINPKCVLNKEVDPVNGGCWFCHRKYGQMARSYEFDCSLHIKCLERAINMNPANDEYKIIYEELIGELPEHLQEKANQIKARQNLEEEVEGTPDEV
jgi:hypothetical protein